MKSKILVVGSINMDLTVTASRFCGAGETVFGNTFSTAQGGKGANQAIQAARLGARVDMLGKVGNDDFGKSVTATISASGVNTQYILVSDTAPTGIADIQIQKNNSGTENRITIVTGANFDITLNDVAFLEEKIREYSMVILQHEIPMEINCRVAEYAAKYNVPVMLNPAPSAKVPSELISCLTYISPNEHEAKDIVGIAPDDESGINNTIKALHNMGVKNVIITLGKEGCAFSDSQTIIRSKSVNMGSVVDPTAAGDSFIGAFCTAVSAGIDYKKALIFANCTAGITVTRKGAGVSLPTLDEVLAAMEQRGIDTKEYKEKL
ncbi:MAG: ribokinase [Clostridia bacterium]|nr:ribokinase [Clostridia bacterium]